MLQQFKNSIPQRIATYVSEQKPPTVLKAAELADDFVLTHKVSCPQMRLGGDRKSSDENCSNFQGSVKFSKSGPSCKPVFTG